MKRILLCFFAVISGYAQVFSLKDKAFLEHSYDIDARNYFSNIVVAGSSIDAQDRIAINKFVVAAKSHGYWANLLDVGPMSGTNLTSAMVKLKAYIGTSSTLTNHSFVSSNYVRFDGIYGKNNCYFDTGINLSNIAPKFGISAFLTKDLASANDQFLIGCSYAAPHCEIQCPSSPNNWTANLGSSFIPGSPNVGGRGLYHALLSDSTHAYFILNGDVQGYGSSPGSSSRSAMISVFAGSGGSYFTQSALGYYAVDDGLMSTNTAAVYALDVMQLEYALHRYIPQVSQQNYALIVGQSLALGGNPTLTITAPAGYLNKGPVWGVNSIPPSLNPARAAERLLRPLTEAITETIASSWANLVSATTRLTTPGSSANDLTISDWGVTGTAYSGLKKGTTPYNGSLTAISNAIVFNKFFATSFKTPGIAVVHGETDGQSTTYQSDIETWQSDYETDIKALTGQAGTIPMFHSQPSSWTDRFLGITNTARSPYAILSAYEANPTKSILVCPKYFLPYSSDGLHLSNIGYRWLGEYYAKAWYTAIALGQTWKPLYPSSVSRSGSNIDLTFSGNVGTLVIDTNAVTDPGSYGFEYTDDSSPPAISTVSITATNVVRVVLAANPTGALNRIRYAYTGIVSNNAGPTTGPRGCLRDSDTSFTSLVGSNLFNWCVHFDKPCP